MVISRIQKDLFDFIDHDPNEIEGLIEFWYKANTNALSAALTEEGGNKIMVNVSNFDQFEQLAKKLFLISDTIILRDTRNWTSDEAERMSIPHPKDNYKPGYLDDVIEDLKHLRPSPFTLNHRPEQFYWTASECNLKNGYDMVYAVSFSYNRIPLEFVNWLTNSGRQYLRTGKIVYAPFIPPLDMELELLKNQVSLSEHYGGAIPFFHKEYEWLNNNSLNALLSLDFPYLKNLDIETISKVKEDHYDDFSNFSRSLLTAVENVKSALGSEDFIREVKYIQRNQIDDNLSKIEQKVKKISSMNTLRKSGVIMGILGINASMYLGAEATTIISGLSAAAIAFVLERVQELREEGQLKENDCYFLWKLKEQV